MEIKEMSKEEIKKDLLIDELVKIKADSKDGKQSCVKALQEISKKLLQEYVIGIGEFTIEPLLLEAYYYNKDAGFEDDSVHAANNSKADTYELARDRQKNHFGELYVHYGAKDGIDIVLSDGNYYLSFLFKNALINNKFAKQCKVSEMLCEKCDQSGTCDKGKKCRYYGEIILKKRKTAKDAIVFSTVRRGLAKDSSFKDEKLAAVTGFELKDENQKPYVFTFEKGYGKEWTVAEYMRCHPEKDRKAQCKALIGYNSQKVLEILEGMERNK